MQRDRDRCRLAMATSYMSPTRSSRELFSWGGDDIVRDDDYLHNCYHGRIWISIFKIRFGFSFRFDLN